MAYLAKTTISLSLCKLKDMSIFKLKFLTGRIRTSKLTKQWTRKLLLMLFANGFGCRWTEDRYPTFLRDWAKETGLLSRLPRPKWTNGHMSRP